MALKERKDHIALFSAEDLPEVSIRHWLASTYIPIDQCRLVWQILESHRYRMVSDVMNNWLEVCKILKSAELITVLRKARLMYGLDPKQNDRDERSKAKYWSIYRLLRDYGGLPLGEKDEVRQMLSRSGAYLVSDLQDIRKSRYTENSQLQPYIDNHIEPWMKECGLYMGTKETPKGKKPKKNGSSHRTHKAPTDTDEIPEPLKQYVEARIVSQALALKNWVQKQLERRA
jgi:hypothetical protein